MKILFSISKKIIYKFFNIVGLRKDIYLANRYPQYKIGRWTYGDLTIRSFGTDKKVVVGSFTSFAQGAKILLGGEHRPDWVTTYPFNVLWKSASAFTGNPMSRGDVIIGHDVWIGTDSLIMSGVTIGDGAVVAARSVVTRDVPPYSIVAGVPAKIVKHRFNHNQIDSLLKIQWWNWPDSIIHTAMPDILASDIDIFIEKANSGHYQ